MKIAELIRYSRNLLRHRRGKVLLICMLPLGGELIFRLAEAALCCIVLYFGSAEPAELFTGSSPELAVCAAVCGVLRWIICPPLVCGAVLRLVQMFSGEEETPLSDILTDMRFVSRSITASLWRRAAELAAFLPGAASGAAFCRIFRSGGGEEALFGLLVTGAFTVLMVMMWLGVRIALTAVPFLTVMRVRRSAFATVVSCLRFMGGRKRCLVKLGAVYFLPLLIGLPFALPELVTAHTLCLSIFLKEDEYGGAKKLLRISGTGGNNERDTA